MPSDADVPVVSFAFAKADDDVPSLERFISGLRCWNANDQKGVQIQIVEIDTIWTVQDLSVVRAATCVAAVFSCQDNADNAIFNLMQIPNHTGD